MNFKKHERLTKKLGALEPGMYRIERYAVRRDLPTDYAWYYPLERRGKRALASQLGDGGWLLVKSGGSLHPLVSAYNLLEAATYTVGHSIYHREHGWVQVPPGLPTVCGTEYGLADARLLDKAEDLVGGRDNLLRQYHEFAVGIREEAECLSGVPVPRPGEGESWESALYRGFAGMPLVARLSALRYNPTHWGWKITLAEVSK